MSKINFKDGGSGGHLGFFDQLSLNYFGLLGTPMLLISLNQMDYRDVQNMLSQHFPT